MILSVLRERDSLCTVSMTDQNERDWKVGRRAIGKYHEKTSHLLTPNYCFQCFEELADLEEDCPICSHDNRQTLEHLKSLDQVFYLLFYL